MKRTNFLAIFWFLVTILSFVSLNTVSAADDPIESPSHVPLATTTHAPAAPVVTPQAPQTKASSYILLDADTGEVLASKNPNERLSPASLTKIMTMYLISDALKRGQIRLTDNVTVSEQAWKTGGSRMFINVGDQVKVQDLIRGIVITSGNDACVAMAEAMAGSEDAFCTLMNQTAQHLGMKNSNFTDSTGMPHPNHYTTAFDMAILARALIKNFPDYYHWYSEKEFTYNNIHQVNRNKLLWSDPSVDGIKTGHTDEAGYCLVASSKRGPMRLITVVMNSTSPNQRAADTRELLAYGFRFFKYQPLFKANQPIMNVRVWYGQDAEIAIGSLQDLGVVVSTQKAKSLTTILEREKVIEAPIQKGQQIGILKVYAGNELLRSVPDVALKDDPKGNVFRRIADSFSLMFYRHFGNHEQKAQAGA